MSDGAHDHAALASAISAGDAANAALIADLTRRVTALEAGSTATPTPTPSPTPTPTPSPTVTAWYPGAATTASDQAPAIAAWLRSNAGAGKVLGIKAGTYRTDTRMVLEGIAGLTLVAPNVFFKKMVASASPILHLRNCTDLAISGLWISGIATQTQITGRVFGSGDNEDEHAIYIGGGARIALTDLDLSSVLGDGIYWARYNDSDASTLPTDLTFTRVVTAITGRNGFSHITGRRVTLTDCSSDYASLHAFDVEPNRTDDVVDTLTLTGFRATHYDAGRTDAGPGYAAAIGAGGQGTNGPQARNVVIDGLSMDAPRSGRAALYVRGPSSTRRHQGVTVRNSKPDGAYPSDVAHVDSWVASNNGTLTVPASGNIG